MFTYPGAPCLYYGDEVGLTGKHDPDCRKGFPWDETRWNHDLLNYTRSIIALRKEHQTLRRGSYQRLYAEERVFAFARKLEGDVFIIALNADDTRKRVAFSVEAPGAGNSAPATIFGPDTQPKIENNILHIEIPLRKGIVLQI
jgi:glycosidase